jgi:[acyl-carrier-protein] S-malonyltransferase
MGKDLYDNFEEIKAIYKEASDALGYDVAELSFKGPRDELNKTFRTQPCLLTASYAAFRVLSLKGIKPVYVAGHSLGEYSAITASGAVSFNDVLTLTEKRGQFMQDAVPEDKGLMAAVLGLDREAINNICNAVTSGYVAPANYNCPGQIVIAGEKPAVEEAITLANEAGARRAVPLAVSAPSHCRLMESASNKLSQLLDSIEFHIPRIPIVNNADAALLHDVDSIKDSLVRQLNNPLLWEDSIKSIIEKGVGTFIETGPKRVLAGLIKRIDGNIKILNVEDSKSLNETLSALH